MEHLLQSVTDPKFVNSIGLLLDIAGVIILFKYGLPNTDGQDTWGGDFEVVAKVRFKGRVGLTLLVVGFALQLISNLLPST